MDRISAMQLYCQIVEAGQLSLAADQLNLSKGTVSKQLSKLEAHLGGRLLNRTTRQQKLTDFGASYLEQCRDILELVDFRISKSELGAFFRKDDHPKYIECGDQILRNFLKGVQIKYRPSAADASPVQSDFKWKK